MIEVEGPDGNVYEFPDGATRDQMVGYFKKQQLSTGERVTKGVVDPIEGGAQILESIVPAPIRNKVNDLNNWLAQYGIVAPVGKGGVAEDVASREREYNRRLRLTPGFENGETDWARIGGGAISPANLALGAVAPAGIAGRLAMGAVQGVMQPDTSSSGEDFIDENLLQAGFGTLGAGAADLVGRGAARIVSPKASTDPQIQLLRKEGVIPTLGQLLGKRASRLEQGMASAPLLGSGIKSARDRAFQDFNRAVANRALRPIGESIKSDVKPGFEMVDDVARRISDKYETLLPNIKGQIDPQFSTEIASLRAMANNMPDTQMNQFNRILDGEVIDRFTPAGLASGETIKNIESKLGHIAQGYRRSADYDQRILGDAIRETQSSLRKMIERVNPNHRDELQAINKSFSQLVRLEGAAVKGGNAEGIFTPAQFTTTIKQQDPTRRKRAFARGKATMQDLARAGQSVLGNTVPDSGTPFRTALGLGMLGGGYLVHPGIFAAEIAAMMPYTKTGQFLLDKAIAGRPVGAQAVAGGLRRVAPFAAAPITYGITDEFESE